MNQRLLSAMTLTLLVILVAFPLSFIALQAVFPQFNAGDFSGAFSGVRTLLAEPQLPAMLGGTLQIAIGVALVSALIGFPLGVARGLLNLPAPRLWDLLFLIPFL
ncbi:MAG: iron ABC transporter permease, partial [Enterobacter sp.]